MIAERQAIVTGTYWWNRPTLRALFTRNAQPPKFIWNFDDALAAAKSGPADLIAWSSRLTAEQERAAATSGVDLHRIEDGFLRSIGLGAGFVTAASLAVDGRGIYYDASRPSDLEHLLQTVDLSDAEINHGAHIRRRILEARLTKYNLHSTSAALPLPAKQPVILVPGQVSDDASILKTTSSTIDPHGACNINQQLLQAARWRHPEAFIIYKPHPDVVSGLRDGNIPAEIASKTADWVTTDTDIIALIERADHIETISSLAGFEALLRGKSVTTHGLPFYAGWGLTDDLTTSNRRTRLRTIDELTVIAFTRYTRHMNPYTGLECTVDELITALTRQRSDRHHHLRNAVLKQLARLCERLRL